MNIKLVFQIAVATVLIVQLVALVGCAGLSSKFKTTDELYQERTFWTKAKMRYDRASNTINSDEENLKTK